MMRVLTLLVGAVGFVAALADPRPPVVCDSSIQDSVYNYQTTLLDGTTFNFGQLKNKQAVFVPSSNYDDRAAVNQVFLRDLAADNPNVTVIMFSTSQFAFGEVFTKADEFMNVLEHVRPGNGFVPPTNMMYTKTADINGIHGTPVFTHYLTRACGYTRPEFRTDITNHVDANNCSNTNPSINMINDVRNPFEAFVIDFDGKVFHRYDAAVDIVAEDLKN